MYDGLGNLNVVNHPKSLLLLDQPTGQYYEYSTTTTYFITVLITDATYNNITYCTILWLLFGMITNDVNKIIII